MWKRGRGNLNRKGGMNNEKEPSRYRSASLPVRQNQRRKIPRSLCNCTPQGTHSPLLRRVPYQTACPMGATSYLHDKESYTPAGIWWIKGYHCRKGGQQWLTSSYPSKSFFLFLRKNSLKQKRMKRNLFSSRVAEIALTMKEIFFATHTDCLTLLKA